MKQRISLLFLTLISPSLLIYGQEIRGISSRCEMNSGFRSSAFKSSKSLEIPKPDDHYFFDDFSQYGTSLYPASTNWLDSPATISYSYADSAISYGVITLDCFDSFGKVYEPIGGPNPSDTLTSRKIDPVVTDNLYLSFFIQGGGKADYPEEEDSLLVQFYQRSKEKWVQVWDTIGFKSRSFTQIILPVADSIVSDSSFQFRFINYTSLSANDVQGKDGALSNADNWHIDYIQVRNANNPNELKQLNDVAIYEMPEPVFKTYTSIPYSHLLFASTEIRGSNTVCYRNHFNAPNDSLSVARTHVYIDIRNNDTLEIKGRGGGIQSTLLPGAYDCKTDDFKVNFKTDRYPDQNWGRFQLISYIQTPTREQYLWNDTIKREEMYMNYYAYDDGTAEFGYGISGADAYETSTAVRFEIYHPKNLADTLTGMYIYFNKAAGLFNANLEFQARVWNESEGNPNQLLYASSELELYTPDTTKGFNNPSDSINGFMRIDFDEDVLVPNIFYVGIIQFTDEFINIGYDVSQNSKSNIRYYSDNTWNSLNDLVNIPEGSLMIRPIFDHEEYSSSARNLKEDVLMNVSVYPNPVNTSLTIEIPSDDWSQFRYNLCDITGRMVNQGRLVSNTIDFQDMEEGIYFLQLFHLSSAQQRSFKIIKTP